MPEPAPLDTQLFDQLKAAPGRSSTLMTALTCGRALWRMPSSSSPSARPAHVRERIGAPRRGAARFVFGAVAFHFGVQRGVGQAGNPPRPAWSQRVWELRTGTGVLPGSGMMPEEAARVMPAKMSFTL